MLLHGSAARRPACVGCDGRISARHRRLDRHAPARDPGHFRALGNARGRPSAAARSPPLLFDYYGFPEHTYRLKYPAPGSPALAARVRELLADADIAADEDPARGYDHGVFVPFLLAFPDADIPVVQLSLRADLDPAAHLAIGRALAPLRDEGVLIVGSGMSYHNLREFWSTRPADVEAAARFDAWLAAAVENPESAARDAQLAAWAAAPGARAAHPRDEHLLPLMVAAGAGGERSRPAHLQRPRVRQGRFGVPVRLTRRRRGLRCRQRSNPRPCYNFRGFAPRCAHPFQNDFLEFRCPPRC